MTFTQWKGEVCRLAKNEDVIYLLPDDNTLFLLWEKKTSPKNVVFWFC